MYTVHVDVTVSVFLVLEVIFIVTETGHIILLQDDMCI